jgi:hypothetical protein
MDEAKDDIAEENRCGSCTACCTVMGVDELAKPNFVKCDHVCATGCASYSTRPQSCRDFECLYLMGPMPPEFRPDKWGVMLATEGSTEEDQVITAFEVNPGALVRQDVLDRLRQSAVMDNRIFKLYFSNGVVRYMDTWGRIVTDRPDKNPPAL